MGARQIGRADVVALRRATLFAGYGPGEIEAVLAMSRTRHLGTGDVLFWEGAPCSACFFLAEGFVELSRAGPAGRSQIVEFVEPGETFAEAAMFSGQGYPVTALALADSRLIEIEAYRFMRFLQAHPQVSWTMLANLSRRLHQLVHRVGRDALQRADQRVAAYLLDNCDPDSEGRRVRHVPARRKELANRVGLSPEALSRVLAGFRARGWIDTRDSSRVVLVDPAALRAVLESGAGARH